MKAVIMAGGEGTRLRPISSDKPKPMVKLVDRPVLGHILELLKSNDIDEACLTLRYLPQTIKDYVGSGSDFGLRAECRVEETVLGTAGSVKACSDFLGDDSFLVISGDCVCDFDLRELVRFHRENDADVTIALHTCEEPLEYGLVVTDDSGKILRFEEKPAWDRVLTDRINTGIYVISPSVLAEIPDGEEYDFGKQLFPRLLEQGRRLYGLSMSGYWCDIGSPGAYLGCCADIVSGAIKLPLPAGEISPGVRSQSKIPPGVAVRPPVYIGSGVIMEPGAIIGPNTVLCSGSVIEEGSTVAGSAILGATVGARSEVSGAVVCEGARVGRDSRVHDGALLGERVQVGDSCVIAPGARIWPDKEVMQGVLVKGDVRENRSKTAPLFSARGLITGEVGAQITPQLCLSLGMAAAGAGRVGIGWCGGEAAKMLAEATGVGVVSAGGELFRYESCLLACAAYVGRSYSLPLTAYFLQSGDRMRISFFGPDGGVLPHEMERRLSAYANASVNVNARSIGQTTNISGVYDAYVAAAARCAEGSLQGLRVAVSGSGAENRALRSAIELAGGTDVPPRSGTPCFVVQGSGTSLTATDEDGRLLDSDQMLILVALTELERGVQELAVPYDAPEALDALAGEYGARILRLDRDGDRAAHVYSRRTALRDSVFGAVQVCSLMQQKGMTLASLARRIPGFHVVSVELPIKSGRGAVMRALTAFAAEAGAELDAGIKIRSSGGTTHVCPARDKNALKITAESESEWTAESLCSKLAERVYDIEAGDHAALQR